MKRKFLVENIFLKKKLTHSAMYAAVGKSVGSPGGGNVSYIDNCQTKTKRRTPDIS